MSNQLTGKTAFVTGGTGGIGAAIPEHEVKHYQDAIEKGSIMIGVECSDGDAKTSARDVFNHFDAEKISHA